MKMKKPPTTALELRIEALEQRLNNFPYELDIAAERDQLQREWEAEQTSTVIRWLILRIEQSNPAFDTEGLRSDLTHVLVEPWRATLNGSEAERRYAEHKMRWLNAFIAECLPEA